MGRVRAEREGSSKREPIFASKDLNPCSLWIGVELKDQLGNEGLVLRSQAKNVKATVGGRLAYVGPLDQVDAFPITRVSPDKIADKLLHGFTEMEGEESALHNINGNRSQDRFGNGDAAG